MAAAVVVLGEHIEQKRIRIIVERLVVEKTLRQQAQILGIIFVLSSIDLEKGQRIFAIDFVARWILQLALDHMSFETGTRFAEGQTKLAQIYAWLRDEFDGVG